MILLVRELLVVVIWLLLAYQLWCALTRGSMPVKNIVIARSATPKLFWGTVITNGLLFAGVSWLLIYLARRAMA